MTEAVKPLEWIRSPLGEIVSFQNGFAFKSSTYCDDGAFVIRIGNVQADGISLHNPAYVNIEQLGAEKFMLRCGDMLMSLTGNVGRVATIREKHLPAVLNQRVARLVPSVKMDSRYIYHLTRSDLVQREIQRSAKGAAQLNISTKDLSLIEVVIPPRAEQKTIAEKLDTLLAQVESTKARLERIPKNLKRFRQSVLAAAVSGRLTEEWRGTNAISFQQPPITIGREYEEVPEGWAWNDLVDLAKLESGHTPRKSRTDYWENGDVPWISLQDIRAAHGRVIEKTKFMPNMKGIENSSARILPRGTVCFSRDISVGYTTIMGCEMATTQHFVNWICSPELNNYYLMYAFMAAKDHLTISGQGSTVKTIYMPACKKFRLIAPPLDEQTEIVRRVDQLFAYADTIETQVNNALERVNNLTQSILAKALRGELTEQWRKDNPDLITGKNSAEALLEKIKAERVAAKPVKRGRKKAK